MRLWSKKPKAKISLLPPLGRGAWSTGQPAPSLKDTLREEMLQYPLREIPLEVDRAIELESLLSSLKAKQALINEAATAEMLSQQASSTRRSLMTVSLICGAMAFLRVTPSGIPSLGIERGTIPLTTTLISGLLLLLYFTAAFLLYALRDLRHRAVKSARLMNEADVLAYEISRRGLELNAFLPKEEADLPGIERYTILLDIYLPLLFAFVVGSALVVRAVNA